MSEDVRRYRDDGFLVVRNALNQGEVDRYRAAVDANVNAHLAGRSSFDGYERVFIQLHTISRRDETLRELTFHPRLARMASLLGDMPRVRLFLDQIVYKQPGAARTVAHQDAPYLSFDDPRSLNCWIALDATTPSNGALEYLAGSHHAGARRLVHLDREDDLSAGWPELAQFQPVLVEAQPGDVVFHDCRVVHRAFSNGSSAPRRAYSIQYMPDGARYNGWLHPFMAPYQLEAGDPLNQDCFPLLYPPDA